MTAPRRDFAVRFVGALALAMAIGAGIRAAQSPMFRPDDPLRADPDTVADAGRTQPQELSQQYDFLQNTFAKPGERDARRAVNVNTIDEVPSSMWFTDRIMLGTMTEAELARGPNTTASLDVADWIVVGAKSSGLQPGFRAVSAADPSRQVYQIEFDPPDHPELATGAEMIGTLLYYALGYHVVENYIVAVDPERITIDPRTTIRDTAGRRRPFTRGDLDDVLRRAARRTDGRYRGLASKFAPGDPMGQFRYHGTRADDPNDIYPHEHRRELRAARVFGAWVNHDDSRANNTLDMREGAPGAQYLRHYMFDFGSIMGSATTGVNTARSGNEYLVAKRPNLTTLGTFGVVAPDWARARWPDYAPAAGPFFAEGFDPIDWKPEYRNPAFENMRPDDAFWGARRVAAFSDRQLHVIADEARYTDQAARDQIVRALAGRRDAIARTWLTSVTPIVTASLSTDGRLTFENAAVAARAAQPGGTYVIRWSRFDNDARQHAAVGQEQRSSQPEARAPLDALAGATYVSAEVSIERPDFPQWTSPVRIYFQRDGNAWRTVGLTRE